MHPRNRYGDDLTLQLQEISDEFPGLNTPARRRKAPPAWILAERTLALMGGLPEQALPVPVRSRKR